MGKVLLGLVERIREPSQMSRTLELVGGFDACNAGHSHYPHRAPPALGHSLLIPSSRCPCPRRENGGMIRIDGTMMVWTGMERESCQLTFGLLVCK